MTFTLRWFGPDDPVTVGAIRQVPGVDGIVTALHDVPAGTAWTPADVRERVRLLAAHGFRWIVAESVPISDAVKLGGPERDEQVDAFGQSLRALAAEEVRVVCYNFMPVIDWFRSELHAPVGDGSTAMRYRQADVDALDLTAGLPRLAAWNSGFDGAELARRIARFAERGPEGLRHSLASFLGDVLPVAEEVGIRLALHTDDPPWPILGIPRIEGTRDDLRWILELDDSPAHGLTFCTGALGALPDADLPCMAGEMAGRIHFLHARNIRHEDNRSFLETAHLRSSGDLDLPAVLDQLLAAGFEGPIRPDHGRTLFGEPGLPGYGLADRAIGLGYLQGIVAGRALGHRSR